MRNLYDILAVKKGATAPEIKKSYRALAKRLHPDTNPDDDTIAEKFKEVSAAYAILGDDERRAKYDRGEINEFGQDVNPFAGVQPGGRPGGRPGGPPGNPFAGGGGFRDGNFTFTGEPDDIFAELFGFGRNRGGAGAGNPFSSFGRGGARARKGADANYSIKVSFLDAATGATQRVKLQNGKTLDVKIPAGLEEGQQIRLAGQGEAGAKGAKAGDALIRVSVSAHKWFVRDGNDIHIDLPITIDEAVSGAKVRVPTLAGSVTMKIPKGASSGQKMRLKGKGIAAKPTAGNQYVTLQIVLPAGGDEKLEDFVSNRDGDAPATVRDHFNLDPA